MIKRILPILFVLVALISACAPQAAPTMLPADVQGTAMSSAWTMIAATQLAIPTATSLPPTEIPSPTSLPTFTPLPLLLPTLQPILPTSTIAAGASDPNSCLKPIDFGQAGKTCRVRVENKSGGPIRLSLNLWKPNAFGQCGAISLKVANNDTSIVELPVGSWYGYAWVEGKNPSTSEGSFEMMQGCDDLLSLVVGKDHMSIK